MKSGRLKTKALVLALCMLFLVATSSATDSLGSPEGWSEDIFVTSGAWAPAIAVDTNNNIHITCLKEEDFNFEIYYIKLDSSGNKLVDDIRLTPTDSADSYCPAIAVDTNNNVHITWMDWRDGNLEIYYTKLDNSGNTLVDDIRLTPMDSKHSCEPAIAVDTNNNVHITWMDNMDENDWPYCDEIYYTKLDNSGNTLVDDKRLTTDSADSYYPVIAVDTNNNVHIAWEEYRDGKAEIYYTKLDSNGNTLVEDTRITTDTDCINPAISVDRNNNVHVIWVRLDYEMYCDNIYYTKLDNSGNTLVDETCLAASSNPPLVGLGIAVDRNNNVHIKWRVYNEGIIYYTKLDNNGNTLIDDTLLITECYNSASAIAVDTNNHLHITWSGSGDEGGGLYYKNNCGGAPQIPVIVIPGAMGSELYNNGELVWIDTGKAHNQGDDRFLNVLMLAEDGETPLDTDNHITTKEGREGLVKYKDYCENLIAMLEANDYVENETYFIYTYDWRKDIRGSANGLGSKIEEVKALTGSDKVNIIAHSMGGLVARYYAKNPTNATNINILILVGTPNYGATNSYYALKFGYNLDYLNQERLRIISQNMTGAYQVLPDRTFFDYYQWIYGIKTYQTDPPYYDEGYLMSTDATYKINSDSRLTNQLLVDNAMQFHDELGSETQVENTYLIYGTGIETETRIKQIEYDWDLHGILTRYEITFTDGDGTVPVVNALLNGIKGTYYIKNGEHMSLPNNEHAREVILSLLQGNEPSYNKDILKQPVGMRDRVEIQLYCPATLSIYDEEGNYLGLDEHGDLNATIPGGYYYILDETKIAVLPNDKNYKILINATDEGTFDLEVESINVTTQVTLSYQNISLTNNTEGVLNYVPNSTNISLSIDYDGDKIFEGGILPEVTITPHLFDTEGPLDPYPSLSGTHNGTITPTRNLSVSRLYTYSCPGTGGHTKYIKIWNSSGWNVTATWTGYIGDWHNITFDEPFPLLAGNEYNYTIKTGSYPQIYHTDVLETANGWIKCTEFTDVNGKEYNDCIPAIRLD